MASIDKVILGQRPTLIEAEKANELIEKINGLLSSSAFGRFITLEVDDDGQITVSTIEQTEIVLCVDGEPVNGSILFAPEEEPEPPPEPEE